MGNKELAVTVTVIATICCLFGELKNPNSGVSPITGKPYRKASVVTGPERERYLALARSWASKLWVTNETYVGHIMQDNRPTWDPLPGFWTNTFEKCQKILVTRNATGRNIWQERITVEFQFDLAKGEKRCKFVFWDDGSERLIAVRNYFYQDPNVPYTYGVWKPLRTNGDEARKKAEDGSFTFEQKNKFCTGDEIFVLSPDKPLTKTVVKKMWNEDGEEIPSCPHPKQKIRILCDQAASTGDILCGIGEGEPE